MTRGFPVKGATNLQQCVVLPGVYLMCRKSRVLRRRISGYDASHVGHLRPSSLVVPVRLRQILSVSRGRLMRLHVPQSVGLRRLVLPESQQFSLRFSRRKHLQLTRRPPGSHLICVSALVSTEVDAVLL